MKGQFFLRQLGGVFEQDVKVTTYIEKDVAIEPGDDVIVQVRATVKSALTSPDGLEVELVDVRPHKIVQVLRKKTT